MRLAARVRTGEWGRRGSCAGLGPRAAPVPGPSQLPLPSAPLRSLASPRQPFPLLLLSPKFQLPYLLHTRSGASGEAGPGGGGELQPHGRQTSVRSSVPWSPSPPHPPPSRGRRWGLGVRGGGWPPPLSPARGHRPPLSTCEKEEMAFALQESGESGVCQAPWTEGFLSAPSLLASLASCLRRGLAVPLAGSLASVSLPQIPGG